MRKMIKKVCMLGDGAVGKTSLIRRFVYDIFEEDYKPTIGTKIVKKVVEVPEFDTELTMVIWDIMGHKSYMQVPPQYYQGAEGVIVVADITRKKTLENLDFWVKTLMMESGEIPIVFVANKIDLMGLAEFGEEDVAEIAKQFSAPYVLTSAKTGEGVNKAFRTLAVNMVRY